METYSTKYLLKRFWKSYVSQHKGRMVIAMLCMIIVAATTAGQVQLIEPMINDVLSGGDISIVYLVAGAFVVIGFVKGVAAYIQRVFMYRTSLLVAKSIQLDMYEALLKSDTEYLEGEGTARHISRFSTDLGNLQALVVSFFSGVIKESLTAIFLFGVMFYNSPEMTFAGVILLPLTLIPIAKIGKKIERISKDILEQAGDMTAVLDDTLKGARQVKSYNLFDSVIGLVGGIFDRVFSLSYRAERTSSLLNPILEIITAFIVAGILIWGGHLVRDGALDAGKFMAFFVALTTAYRPIKALSNLNLVLRGGVASAKRVFGVLDKVPSISDKPNAKPIKIGNAGIELKNVNFDYKTKKGILNNIDITIPAGKSVALVGTSGGGKSTILNLISRFYDPVNGEILIDKQNIKDITLESLRYNIALVSQETVLFNTTIGDNVGLGKISASEDDIIDALKKSSAWDFVKKLDDGLDSKVGERGLQLSGGQRQRIAIARAFLKDAPILLLDEATSALDSVSEQHIQRALQELMTGRTTITIAHRLSTIINADIIYVIDDGKVVEFGSHDELQNKKGVYANLYNGNKL